jgi:hypothetical protein
LIPSEFRHEGEILLVDLSLIHLASSPFFVLAKAGPRSPLLAVASDMTDSPTGGADHVVGDVRLVLTLPGLVIRSPAVGTPHLTVLAECAVQQRQLS